MKQILPLLCMSILLMRCSTKENGRYVISTIKEGTYYRGDNDTIRNYLKHKLLNSKYDLFVQDHSVSLRSLNTHTELLLKIDSYLSKTTYKASYTLQNADFQFSLQHDTSYVLTVRLWFPSDKPLILPTQVGSSILNAGNANSFKEATVVCYLTKVD